MNSSFTEVVISEENNNNNNDNNNEHNKSSRRRVHVTFTDDDGNPQNEMFVPSAATEEANDSNSGQQQQQQQHLSSNNSLLAGVKRDLSSGHIQQVESFGGDIDEDKQQNTNNNNNNNNNNFRPTFIETNAFKSGSSHSALVNASDTHSNPPVSQDHQHNTSFQLARNFVSPSPETARRHDGGVSPLPSSATRRKQSVKRSAKKREGFFDFFNNYDSDNDDDEENRKDDDDKKKEEEEEEEEEEIYENGKLVKRKENEKEKLSEAQLKANRLVQSMNDFRSHFINTKHSAARLHVSLQAVQIIPPNDDDINAIFHAPSPPSSLSPSRISNKNNNKQHQQELPAASFITPFRQDRSSPSFFDVNNNTVAGSPIQREVYSPSRRRNFDLWYQEELEFTQICFFKLEDVSRCKLMKMRRETMEEATIYTFERLLDDCVEQEMLQRFELWRAEEATTMELFCNVELQRLIARREDFMLRLSALKVYLRMWPTIQREKRELLVMPEDAEWAQMLKMNTRQIKKIEKAPLARFWVRRDAEMAKMMKEDEEMMRKIITVEDEEEHNYHDTSDDDDRTLNNPSNTNRNLNHESRSFRTGAAGSSFGTSVTRLGRNNSNATNFRTSRPSGGNIVSSVNNNNNNNNSDEEQEQYHHHQIQQQRTSLVLKQNDQKYQQHITLVKSQRQHLIALERRDRSLLQEERFTEFQETILLPGLSIEEFFFRLPLQDKLWAEQVRIRQKFVLESERVVIFDKEHYYRQKWKAMENVQWRMIKEFEEENWKTVMNRAAVCYQITGMLFGRVSKQYLLEKKAGNSISLFARQRREVLRVHNKHKNFAKFFQRCGRGYLLRRQACADRLYMLKCKKEALDRLKLRLSFLLSRFLRARFSRGQTVLLDRVQHQLQTRLQSRLSGLLVWKKHNTQVLFPQAKILLAHLYSWYSAKRVVHDQRRVHHCARVLQRSLKSFSQRQRTHRIVLLHSRMLFFIQSSHLVHKKRTQKNDLVLSLFVKSAVENLKKSIDWNKERLRAALTLQKVGRGSLCRNYSLRPDHLYQVQEQLCGVYSIQRWFRKCSLKYRERTNERQGNRCFFSLRQEKRNTLLDAEYYLDRVQVPFFAAATIQKWWRMSITKRKYCAWKIANFFLRHRMQTQHNYLRYKFLTKEPQYEASVDRFHDERNKKVSFLVIGSEEHEQEQTLNNTKVSNIFIVVGESESESEEEQELRDENLCTELEESFFEGYSQIVEAYVAETKNIKILFKFDLHEARHRAFTRKLKSLQLQEFAVRSRIHLSNLNWWKSFKRMMLHYSCCIEEKAKIAKSLHFYFVPHDKKDFSPEKEREKEIQLREERKILHGFSIPAEEMRLIRRQRKFMEGDLSGSIMIDDEDLEEDENDSKSSAFSRATTTTNLVDLIRQRRKEKEKLEEERKKKRPLSALLDLSIMVKRDEASSSASSTLLAPSKWLSQQKSTLINNKDHQRPFSAAASGAKTSSSLMFAGSADNNDSPLINHHHRHQEIIREQRAISKLHPPTGKHFDLYTGIFDVCRWWGNKMQEQETQTNVKAMQFGGASLEEVCQEVLRCKPIEVLGLASIWFPLNGGALAALVNSALIHNRKNLKRVHVLTKLDSEFVQRMLRRERLQAQVKVLSLECDKKLIDDFVL